MDTSLVSTDNINNPRTMNAIYNVAARLDIARRWGTEDIEGGERNNKQFNDYVASGPLTDFFKPPGTVLTPHILKDGSDSIGVLAALNRVYLNIGLYSEEWLRHFNPVVGGKPISPILIATAERNSSYWQATEAGTPDVARFLLKAGRPDHLKDAPGGEAFLSKDPAQLDRGATVFAETCARCHSSKQPPQPVSLDSKDCIGPNYLACWSDYWNHTKTEDYKKQMREIVHAPDFLDNNALTTDVRIPVTLLQTNACSPLASNALENNIWDNFSSHSYKSLPSVGSVTVHDPFTGEPRQYPMPAGGRGYTRPPSLISLWSTAPFLLNNTVGPFKTDAPFETFSSDPSVEGRMKVFQTSIEQMLWPERRRKDAVLGDKVPGFIDRTNERSWVSIPAGFQPEPLRPLRDLMRRRFPGLVDADGNIRLGPIPAGTPVNLLASLQLLAESKDLRVIKTHALKIVDLLLRMQSDLASLPPGASDEEARQKFANLAGPMLALSKCPDFVVNRGHYFGTNAGEGPGLSDSDKEALIAFLKTF
jgi:cytochrome c2